MRHVMILTVLWLGLAGPSAATEPVSFRLDNGLELVVISDRRAPVVTHMIWYRAGSADEPPGQSGIAHYLEHLLFKATDTLAEGEFSATIEAMGGRENAFTSYDYTAYHVRIAAEHLETIMQMEADRMVNLRLDLSNWLAERDVILEERGQTLESSPDRVLQEQMRAALFLNHPYGRSIIGWRHEMEQLDDVAALAFYRQHYAPNNAVVIVAGDIDPDDALAMATRQFGDLPANPDLHPRLRPLEPPHLVERRITMSDPRVARDYVSRIYLTPARRSGDQREAAALQMLAALLAGSSQTSVLERVLTHDQGIALSVWAGYMGTALDHGTFSLGILPADGIPLDQAEAALDQALADFIEGGVDIDQLERVRMQIRAQAVYELDNAGSRARTLGTALTTGLTLADSRDWLDVLQGITPDEILAAARSLDRRASVTGWMQRDQ